MRLAGYWRGLLALLVLALSALPAAAHNLPYSLATIAVEADGHYRLELNCHTAALIVGLPQMHLSPENRAQFAALPDAEIEAREAAMSDYLGQALGIYADGRRQPTPPRRFPPVAEIRADAAQTPASQSTSAPIVLIGELPPGVQRLELVMPENLGTVLLQLRSAGEPISMQALTPAQRSQPYDLHLKTSLWVAVQQYLRLGIGHILSGPDHLVFVLGLLMITPNRWSLLKTISAFTVAHSITLAIATLGGLTLSQPLIDMLIGLSILFLGVELVRMKRGGTSLTIRHPWAAAFAFGLLHGLGFASGLSVAGLPHAQIPLALLLFNVGVEIGQLVFVGGVLGLMAGFRLMGVAWPRAVARAPAYTVAGLGAFWAAQYALQVVAG